MSDTAFSLLQYRIHSGVRYCIELLSLWPLLIWNIFMALLRQFWRMLPLTFLPQYNTPSLWVCVKHCTQSTCPSLVMLILITWVMFCSISPLYHYFKKKKYPSCLIRQCRDILRPCFSRVSLLNILVILARSNLY